MGRGYSARCRIAPQPDSPRSPAPLFPISPGGVLLKRARSGPPTSARPPGSDSPQRLSTARYPGDSRPPSLNSGRQGGRGALAVCVGRYRETGTRAARRHAPCRAPPRPPGIERGPGALPGPLSRCPRLDGVRDRFFQLRVVEVEVEALASHQLVVAALFDDLA